jgi:hypothetical protein
VYKNYEWDALVGTGDLMGMWRNIDEYDLKRTFFMDG